MQERTLNGAQTGENTDIFTTLQIFERFWKIGSWLTDSEPNNEPNFSIMHIFYDFSFKTKTSDLKQVQMRRNSVETLCSIVDWLACDKRKDLEKIKSKVLTVRVVAAWRTWMRSFLHPFKRRPCWAWSWGSKRGRWWTVLFKAGSDADIGRSSRRHWWWGWQAKVWGGAGGLLFILLYEGSSWGRRRRQGGFVVSAAGDQAARDCVVWRSRWLWAPCLLSCSCPCELWPRRGGRVQSWGSGVTGGCGGGWRVWRLYTPVIVTAGGGELGPGVRGPPWWGASKLWRKTCCGCCRVQLKVGVLVMSILIVSRVGVGWVEGRVGGWLAWSAGLWKHCKRVVVGHHDQHIGDTMSLTQRTLEQ